MKEISIQGTARQDVGKKATRELRRQGAVPCVLYGVERDENQLPKAVAFSVNAKDLRNLIYSPDIFVVNLNIDGKECKAVMKDAQFHPVKDNVLHVDFYQITSEKPIVMAVPITLTGHAVGVRAGGKLNAQLRRIKVKATYDKIPEKLAIDVSALEIGKSIKVGQLSFEGLELITPKEVVVCNVRSTRAATQAADAAAADTAAAPAAAAPAAEA